MSTLLVELIAILVNASMYYNYDFDLIFFIVSQYNCELVKLIITEVRQASKSTTGTLWRSFEITRWSVNTLLPRKMQLQNNDFEYVDFYGVRLLQTTSVFLIACTLFSS